MNTIPHFNNIANGFNRIASSINGLNAEFTSVAPITDLDKAQIDVMVASAHQMIAAAEALKIVQFLPTPDPLDG